MQHKILEALNNQYALTADEMFTLTSKVVSLTNAAYKDFAPSYAARREVLSLEQRYALENLYKSVVMNFPKEDLHVLDIGAGHGVKTAYLQTFQRTKCMAVDNSSSFIDLAPSGINYLKADMLEIPLKSNSQHIILHHATLHHLPFFNKTGVGVNKAIEESLRLLHFKGVLDTIFIYGDDAFFDETGRFFQPFTEDDILTLFQNYPASITRLSTFNVPSKHDRWKKWIHVQIEKDNA